LVALFLTKEWSDWNCKDYVWTKFIWDKDVHPDAKLYNKLVGAIENHFTGTCQELRVCVDVTKHDEVNTLKQIGMAVTPYKLMTKSIKREIETDLQTAKGLL